MSKEVIEYVAKYSKSLYGYITVSDARVNGTTLTFTGTAKNKKTKEEVYRSAVEDMLFGDTWEQYTLYKSHVNEYYISSGIAAHRGYAVVPLYNQTTGEAFPSGDYILEFNYKLAGLNGQVVTQKYTLHLDDVDPVVESLNVSTDSITINVKENYLAKAVVGKYTKEFEKTSSGKYSVTFDRAELETHLNENMNTQLGRGRLFIGLTDQARNSMGALVTFDHNKEGLTDNVTFQLIQHPDLTLSHDFRFRGDDLIVTKYDAKRNKYDNVDLDGVIALINGDYKVISTEKTRTVVVNVCGGNVATTSVVLTAIAGIAIVLVVAGTKRRKEKEVTSNE